MTLKFFLSLSFLFIYSCLFAQTDSFDSNNGIFVDPRDGKKYKWVRIGDQTWMAENLNFGTAITTKVKPMDNEIVEKFCYNNDTMNCKIYGGLYAHREVFSYQVDLKDALEKSQGICPPGWHVPSDYEWTILEAYVDSKYKDLYPVYRKWNNSMFLHEGGKDAGTNLRSKHGWKNLEEQPDLYGFDALPAGRVFDRMFIGFGKSAIFWTSSWYVHLTISKIFRTYIKELNQYYCCRSISNKETTGIYWHKDIPPFRIFGDPYTPVPESFYSVRCIKNLEIVTKDCDSVDYTLIYIIYNHGGYTDKIPLYFNDRFIFNLKNQNRLQYKVYSEGTLNVKRFDGKKTGPSLDLLITHGKFYGIKIDISNPNSRDPEKRFRMQVFTESNEFHYFLHEDFYSFKPFKKEDLFFEEDTDNPLIQQ